MTVGYGNTETRAKLPQLFLVQLLLLVGYILPFPRLAESIPFDGPRQDDARCSLVLYRSFVGRVDLVWVMPAESQLPDLLVGEVLDHLE